MSLWKDFPALNDSLAQMNGMIETFVEQSPSGLREELHKILFNGGKRLRPAFVLLGAGWGEKPPAQAIPLAAAVELLHTASLIHDDILDKALTRRGTAALHRTLGIKKAVLAGDLLLGKALELASHSYSGKLVPLMAERLNRMLESEVHQDFSTEGLLLDRETYFERIRGKTAELFGLSCQGGAIACGAAAETGEKLYELGIAVGMAFQIDDDILDYRGTDKALGKRAGKDLREGIPTLPFILAREDSDPGVLAHLKRPFPSLCANGLRKRLIRKGYTDLAMDISGEYKNRAGKILQSLPDTFPAKSAFSDVLDRIQDRTN